MERDLQFLVKICYILLIISSLKFLFKREAVNV